MLSHFCIGITDFERALAFYTPVLAAAGLVQKYNVPARSFAGWIKPGQEHPVFFITTPFDGAASSPGNGNMIALEAAGRAVVDQVDAAAIAHGGRCEGSPGLRPHYHPDYYGAYFRDPDGNKLCICCHAAEN